MSALSTFFAINLPYGIKRNEDNEWFAFNRKYIPLGWNTQNAPSIHSDGSFSEHPLYTKYKGLTEAKLMQIASSEKFVTRDAEGKIKEVYLYLDENNPNYTDGVWENYFEKIKILSSLLVQH